MKFNGKKAVVVGGGGGIGSVTCIELAKEGADVAVLDYSIEKSEKVAGNVTNLGRKAMAMQIDVAVYTEVDTCIKRVYEEFKRIDFMINMVGYAQLCPLADMTEKMWDRSIAVHLKGVFNCTRTVINDMIAQRSGRIVNFSSIAGVSGTPGNSHYSAAKAGIIGFCKAVAKEVAPFGITVNAIAPGVIDTPMLRDAPRERVEEIAASTPVGRMGKPSEIAATCLFLLSEEAGFITGQVINVNGGVYT